MSSGAASAGAAMLSQPSGFHFASSRFTNWLRALSVERLTEYGSVTSFVTMEFVAYE